VTAATTTTRVQLADEWFAASSFELPPPPPRRAKLIAFCEVLSQASPPPGDMLITRAETHAARNLMPAGGGLAVRQLSRPKGYEGVPRLCR